MLTMNRLKKLGLGALIGVSLGLISCGESNDPIDIAFDFSGDYVVDVHITPTLDFDIAGLTTDKTLATTTSRADFYAVPNPRNLSNGEMRLVFSAPSLGIGDTDWWLELNTFDFHRVEGQPYPAYRLKDAWLWSHKLFGFNGKREVDKGVLRWVNGPNFTFEGTISLPVSALTNNLSAADAAEVSKAVKQLGSPAHIPLHLKIVTSKGVRTD